MELTEEREKEIRKLHRLIKESLHASYEPDSNASSGYSLKLCTCVECQAREDLLSAYDSITALFDRVHLAMEKLADDFDASTSYKAAGKIMREAWKKALKGE